MCPMPDDGRDPEERSALDPTDHASDDGAVSPDELDIESEENVVSLDQDRYVIGTDQRPTVPEDAGDSGSDGSQSGDGGARASESSEQTVAAGPMDSGAVKEWLEDDLDSVRAKYGFHVTAKSDDAISHQQMFSDDVGAVFDSLLRWYAQQLTTETAVEDVLGILLTESNVRVRYSPSCLQAILETYDLGPDDTIADLFEAVQDDRGMVFPPENVR
ncbi:DUF7500 family protein [Halorussus pelagicus]|uniref:DUF7500 family protein n=1 Tax=Halorussus pelagicus TaxID=2505977 RepID=UPI000FFBE532|nr:hypothetical protein [Halorussus pelagicus]